jgi:hypothetical protein
MPSEFRDTYLSGYPDILQYSNYPPVPPVYWNLDLNRAARAHAVDMATTPCFQHNSCDGTLWHVRIRSYYTENAGLAENIAYGYSDSFDALLAFLLDNGAPDNSAGDGHRRNIMAASMRELGCGYAMSNRPYYVQDFGGGAPDFSTPIAGGCHLFLNGGTTSFFVNFYDPSGFAPQQASLVIDDAMQDLALDLGQAAQGTYAITLPRGTDCRPYYFLFVDGAGTTWRYPEEGSFATSGEGGCSIDYIEEAISVNEMPSLGVALRQNVPNPFRYTTAISFQLSQPARVRITIHNVAGRLVRGLLEADTPAGNHQVVWDGRDANGRSADSGIYFCRLSAAGESRVRQILLLR